MEYIKNLFFFITLIRGWAILFPINYYSKRKERTGTNMEKMRRGG